MAYKSTLFALAIACLAATTSLAARELSLAARLEAQVGLMECWDALWEIKSYSNEIILFFMNGCTYMSLTCCKSIGTITHNCWPAMLSFLGLTVEETYVLHGYWDASTSSPPSSTSPAMSPMTPTTNSVVMTPV